MRLRYCRLLVEPFHFRTMVVRVRIIVMVNIPKTLTLEPNFEFAGGR